MHLKCCGTAGSAEDKTRMAQAAKINETWRSALARDGSKVRVLGGDLNLVGSRAPLETLLAGLDSDGSALAVANPQILGDAAELTWRDGKTEFPPGRLDYIAYSGATAEVAQAFVVDTGRFSAKALASMGLDSDDTGASDHLPVVVDLVPR
jgi:endonuclease/exonuclease/phosphatase family metal-dependent hydrolase